MRTVIAHGVEYDVVWDGAKDSPSLIGDYNSTCVTKTYCDAMRSLFRPERKEQTALKEGYRIAGRKRRKRQDDPA